MAPPVVTTIIPTYRRPALLKRAIESALAQTRPELRVLVCDNASGDETGDVVAELARRDPRVVYRRHERNMGAYFNFQYGIDAVDTEMFSFLSDDDLLLPDLYRRAVDALERERDLGFYASQVVIYDTERGTHRLRPTKYWRAGRHEAGESVRLMTEQHVIWTGCVFRTAVRDAIGPLELVPMSDVLFTAKASAAFPFVLELRPGALFSETGSNYSTGLPVESLRRSVEIARSWAEGLAGLTSADREQLVRVIDGRMLVVAHGMLRDAAEAGNFARFTEVADYLEARPDLSPRRRARIAFARRGGWRFSALSAWTKLQSGYKRRKSSGWKTLSVEEIVAQYS
jgi:glycosyltransferase involved in cell wall biosynthesis